MPIYTFRCDDCDGATERFFYYDDYLLAREGGFPGLACKRCESKALTRDTVTDMRTQYTERNLEYGDTVPEEVAGQGGYSRERKKLLKEAKLVEKGDLPRRRKPYSRLITATTAEALVERARGDSLSLQPPD